MPDHIHALILFDGAKRMSEVIKDWKRWIARTLNIKWQDGYFDHRLRSQDSLIQKRSYILDNPVRAGLCDKAEDWPFRVTW
ncbi:transposase [Verrucomicrobiaceae bacterium N1E253]|uniref:Transposase n=1 Tax=Oceaniferula marina TaxID=2748318 RepID=A0A851GN15_9BACT|nr:transposase [Oceaniferula marina]